MEIVDSTPFLNTKRMTIIGEGYYIEADYNSVSDYGSVLLKEREGGLTLLRFDHLNPFGAARTLAACFEKGH
jgi:hypothetical protein